MLPLWIAVLFSACASSAFPLNAWLARENSPFIRTIRGPICDITKYGAKGDGKTLNTKAIQSAINDCASQGGGLVRIPADSTKQEAVFVSGPIFLKSNIVFFVEKNARLMGTSDKSSSIWTQIYTRREGTMVMTYSSLINGGICSKINFDKNKIGDQCQKWVKIENVTIAGQGIIDGNGHSGWYDKPYSSLRPCLLNLMWVSGLTIRDVTLTNSPFWVTHPLFSNNILVEDVTIDTDGPNTDGIDPDSCENVIVRGCHVSTGDDCIAIKSGKDADGRAVGRRTANVLIENMVFGKGHGISIGSEMSGDVVSVLFRNLSLTGTDRGPRIKSQRGRGGTIANITYEDLKVANVDTGISVSMYYDKSSSGVAPVFRNITVRQMTGTAKKKAGEFLCLPESHCQDIRLDHVDITAKDGFDCENAYGTSQDVSPTSCLKKSV